MKKRYGTAILWVLLILPVACNVVTSRRSGSSKVASDYLWNHSMPSSRTRGSSDSIGYYTVAANVESFRKGMPDPALMNHIFYAFGEVNESFNGLNIQNPERFDSIVGLRSRYPHLRISLFIGGDKSGGFSEMTSDDASRRAFVADLKSAVDRYKLDGIAYDWEWPGLEINGVKGSEEDAANYVKLMHDTRRALGDSVEISFYSSNLVKFVDYDGMLTYSDYVMVGGYNLGLPPRHQCALYPSERFGDWCIEESIRMHLRAGVPREKIVLGIPMFARCDWNGYTYVEHRSFGRYLHGFKELWDDEAMAPYYADENGKTIATFDNERSIRLKCEWVKENGFKGVHYWNYDADDSIHSFARAISSELMNATR